MAVLASYSEHLPLSDHPHRLEPLNDCPLRLLRPRSLYRMQATLDMTMIGFDPIIPVSSKPVTTALSNLAFGLQLSDCCRIAAVAVN